MRRHNITVEAKTTVGGTVRTGYKPLKINGLPLAREGDEVYCPECDSTGHIACEGPRRNEMLGDRRAALEDDLCLCKCDPPPRLKANQTIKYHTIDTGYAAPGARVSAQPAAPTAARQPAGEPPRSSFTSAPKRPAPSFAELPGQVCENLWLGYQQRAEIVVAPGGKLIADPKARNRAINAAYAQLWRFDPRFQWAGLAAFASKQVGCGLLHAAESVEKIQAEFEAQQQLENDARKGFWGLFSPSERERQAKIQAFEQRKRDLEQANRDNPVPFGTFGSDDKTLSYAQRLYQFTYEMLAMGNTTLFLDVFPLHVFYAERGLEAFEACLPSREYIVENGQHPVIWPVAQETLKFGTNHKEILLTFQAIEAGNIAESVKFLATHEQVNILQPVMYDDWSLKWLLRGNHASYVTNFPSGAAQAIELTLASQCHPEDDGRSIGFGNNPLADLSDIKQRMAFVLRAAAQFDHLLQSEKRHQIEQSIRDIALGGGVR
jgi:uncharacterized Zn-binding protein involved in type VI secretion